MDPWVIWLIAGIVLIALEMVIPGTVLIFFGLGALLAASLAATGLVSDLGTQLAIFGISSLLMLFTLRKLFFKTFSGASDNNNLSDEFVNKEAVVLVSLTPNKEGRIELKGANWRARSTEAIEAGSRVIITKRDNLVLWVSPLS